VFKSVDKLRGYTMNQQSQSWPCLYTLPLQASGHGP
jgi:hypothetical protein